MNLRSVWRKGSMIVLGASLVGGALVGAASVSAQAPTIPSLFVITGVKDVAGAAQTSGTVSAWVGTTKCSEGPISATLALQVGQPNQPAACTSAAAGSAVTFQVDGKAATATPAGTINPGVPQNIALQVSAAAPAAPAAPAPGATGNGGYLGGSESDGMMAMALGAIALTAVGGGVAVRRIRR